MKPKSNTDPLTINDILNCSLKELSEEDLLTVFGGSGSVGDYPPGIPPGHKPRFGF